MRKGYFIPTKENIEQREKEAKLFREKDTKNKNFIKKVESNYGKGWLNSKGNPVKNSLDKFKNK